MKLNQVENIVNDLNIKFTVCDLEKIGNKYANAFYISNNLVYLYPLNDGRPTKVFEFYSDNNLVIDNTKEYSQISNLDDIILEVVRLYNYALDNGIVLDPYCFMLELSDELCSNYHGMAKLVITGKTIRNQELSEQNFDEANKYFINRFLDQFIGWNFGMSINRSEILKKELIELNNKVIGMGIREYAGSGLEVFGVEDYVQDGLQHYYLPTFKPLVNKKLLK